MSTIAPRLSVVRARTTADGIVPVGAPDLPRNVRIDIPGGPQNYEVPAWTDAAPAPPLGSFTGFEYRSSDPAQPHLAVIYQLADLTLPDGGAACLVLAFVPAATIDGANPTYDLMMGGPTGRSLVVAQWPVVRDAGGNFVVPDLDADATPVGALARDAWPAGWRVRLPTDANGSMGDPAADPPVPPTPPAPPSGARCIGAMLEWA
jgi:hypothetical protein